VPPQSPLPGRSLLELFPNVAAEADGWDPATVAAKSNTKLPWRCAQGHTWEAPPNNRTGVNLSGCPSCAGRVVISGQNDLATLFPEVAKDADGWDPSTVTAQSGRQLPWRCSLDHRWETSPGSRTGKSAGGCPYCSNHRVLVGFNDLATTHPELALEADGWDPREVTSGSSRVVRWRCAADHTWETPVHHRARKGRGCGVCKNQILLQGFNDLATVDPELAKEAHGWDPRQVLSGAKQKREWRCKAGHVFEASLTNRIRGKGCPYCSHRRVFAGETDLATLAPHLIEEADGWDTTTVTASSKKLRPWKCSLGHQWVAAVGSRFKGNGCPVCAGKVVVPGFNDLATANPELAAEADGWDPTTRTKYSPKKVGWRCPLGHRYEAAVNNRSGGKGCPYCAGTKVLVGFNDLASCNPELASQAVGWDPSTVTTGSGNKKRWKCGEGHEWMAPPSERTRGQGCPSCARSGFDPNADGYLYFLSHETWYMQQIGITNQPENRLTDHRRLGWDVLEVRGPMEGHLANSLETAILRSLRRRGVQFANSIGGKRFDGWSEAWQTSAFEAADLKQLLDFVYEDETPS
jgi:hypothetical protein